jgi:nicotinate phosphoribosyltransferase
MVDIATRVYNHKWKIDPIVRSLIDTDFYKLLMCQSVFRNKPDTQVTFSLINRTTHIPLADLIDEGELREQLDHIRTLRLRRGESTWMRGNTFYGKRQMFTPEFMDWFEALQLPPYHLERVGDQYELTFEGKWPEVMLWEIPALAVLMELRGRAVLRDMGRFELQVLYARAMTKLWEKIERLQADPRPAHRRFRHPPPPFLPLAGLGRAGHAGGAGRRLRRHLQLPHRQEPRPGGHRHQRPRTAHGLRRPGRDRRRPRPRPL